MSNSANFCSIKALHHPTFCTFSYLWIVWITYNFSSAFDASIISLQLADRCIVNLIVQVLAMCNDEERLYHFTYLYSTVTVIYGSPIFIIACVIVHQVLLSSVAGFVAYWIYRIAGNFDGGKF